MPYLCRRHNQSSRMQNPSTQTIDVWERIEGYMSVKHMLSWTYLINCDILSQGGKGGTGKRYMHFQTFEGRNNGRSGTVKTMERQRRWKDGEDVVW